MLLQQLIQIPSVNPDHASPDFADVTHEHSLACFLSEWLSHLGAEVILEEIQPRRPNLIARFSPLDGRPRILFGPHLDTVGIENMTIDPFSGEIHDGKIWGRGASDTKGPMAAMLLALAENQKILKKLPVAIDFVAFMGEEASQHGSKHFVKQHGKDYSFAIVGEPTSMQIVHQTKGSLWATLQAKGKAAHSSQPHLGENAILIISRSLLALQEYLEPILSSFSDPLLGCSTLNFGVIQGGTRPNIVPDRAEVQIDIRQTPSLYNSGGAFALLKQSILELGLDLEISYAHENPPMETDPTHPMIQKLLATDSHTRCIGAPWFSDAAHLSAGGIPSICMGPGSIDQAHTHNEFIELSQVDEAQAFFSQFIQSFQG